MSEDKRSPRERAYDEHVAPLMTQIIAACTEHGIPMIASFELDGPEPEDQLHCTTALLEGNNAPSDDRLLRALAIIRPPTHSFAFTISKA